MVEREPEQEGISYLTTREAANLIGVDYNTVYNAVRSGRLASTRLRGTKAIRREDALAFAQDIPPRTRRRDRDGGRAA